MNGYFITGIAAGLLGIALGVGGTYTWESRAALAERNAEQKAQLAAVSAARAEEQRRTAAQQKEAENAAKERDQARTDARAAATAADGLRKRVAQLVAAGHSAAAAGSPATGDALDLLADVLGRADESAGELAAYADASRIAGQQCERDYDALTARSE